MPVLKSHVSTRTDSMIGWVEREGEGGEGRGEGKSEGEEREGEGRGGRTRRRGGEKREVERNYSTT